MYCKQCGNQIEDDSKFCKYCGASLCDSNCKETHSTSKLSLYDKFMSFSQGKQIALLSYCIWFLGWLGYLIICSGDRHFAEEVVFPFFLAVVVLPFIILTVIHIRRIQNTKNHNFQTKISNKPEVDNNSFVANEAVERNPTASTCTEENYTTRREVERFTLKEFSILHGKMQAVADSSSGVVEHYCIFTNENGIVTKVSYATGLLPLSAQEISEKKNNLCIIEYEDKTYLISVKY